MKTQWFEISGLVGMDDRLAVPPHAASDVVDMTWDPEGYWRNAPGYNNIATLGNVTLDSIHWFFPSNSRRSHLLYEEKISDTTSRIKRLDFPAGTGDTISLLRRRVPSGRQGVQWMDYGHVVYYIDGINPPMCWNEEYESQVGFDGPAASPAVAGPSNGWAYADLARMSRVGNNNYQAWHREQRGVGELLTGLPGDGTTTNPEQEAAWRYGYSLTWINERGHESPPSPIVFAQGVNKFNPIAGNAYADRPGRYLCKVTIPSAPDHVRGVVLYRTLNLEGVDATSGFALYRVRSFQSGARVDYIDATPDNELGPQLNEDSVGAWPQGARLLAMWKGHLWIAGMPSTPSRVRFSAPLFIEQMPETNYIDVGGEQAGQITALRATPNALLVFRERSIQAIKGDSKSGFYEATISSTIGAVGPDSIIEVPRQGTAFLSAAGPYLLRGAFEEEGKPSELVFLGKRIRKTWRQRANPAGLERAKAVLSPEHQEVWWQIPEGGDHRQKLGLVYHYAIGGWSRRDGWPASCFSQHNGVVYFGTWDSANHAGGVFAVSYGFGTKDGDTISATWETSVLDGKTRERQHGIQLLALGVYKSRVQVEHRGDRKDTWVDVSDTNRRIRGQEEDRPLWGTDVWSATEVWTDNDLCVVPVSFDANGLSHQYRFTATDLRLVGFRVGFDPRGAGTNIQVLERDP